MNSMNRRAEVRHLAEMAARARGERGPVSPRGGAAVGGGAGVAGCGWQPAVWDRSWGYEADGPYGPAGFGYPGAPAGYAGFAGGFAPPGAPGFAAPAFAAPAAAPAGAMARSAGGGQAGMYIDPQTGQPVPWVNNSPYGVSPVQPWGGAWGAGALCGLYSQARGVQTVDLGFTVPGGTLAANSTVQVIINPSVPIQAKFVRFPSIYAAQIALISVTSGTDQLILGSGIPGQLGSEVSIENLMLATSTTPPGSNLILTIQNISAVNIPVPPGSPIGALRVEALYC